MIDLKIFKIIIPHSGSRLSYIKKYKTISIDEQKYGLWFYGSFFKLLPPKGRPKQIWHEDKEYFNSSIKYRSELNLKHILNSNHIEIKEFEDKIDINKENFIFWDYGPYQ